MAVLGAGEVVVGGSITFLGALAAVIATLRYIKRTEDDSVDGLRETIRHLEKQLKDCRRESKVHSAQLEALVKILRNAGLAIPDNFWD